MADFNKDKFKQRKRRLSAPTAAERALAEALRRRGHIPRREWPLPGGFFADFWFRTERVCVELDSGDHRSHDADRTATLAQHNIVVVRHTNTEVLADPEAVVLLIETLLAQRGLQDRRLTR